VVQAWDNCGGIGKTTVSITVSARGLQPARFLYATTNSFLGENQHIWGYRIDSQTGALSSTNQGPLAGVTGARALASDRGGYRLYVGTTFFDVKTNIGHDFVSGYFIDRRNGHLNPVPVGVVLGPHWDRHRGASFGKLVFAGTNDFKGLGSLVFAFGVSSDVLDPPAVPRCQVTTPPVPSRLTQPGAIFTSRR
jgi:hypothetical protein